MKALVWLTLFCLASLSSAIKLDDKPVLLELRRFPKLDGKSIDLAAEIVDYNLFATCILDDRGNKLAAIKKGHGPSVTEIMNEVFNQWLIGRGKQPVEWRTFIDCLVNADYHELVKDLREEMEDKEAGLDRNLDPEHNTESREPHNDFCQDKTQYQKVVKKNPVQGGGKKPIGGGKKPVSGGAVPVQTFSTEPIDLGKIDGTTELGVRHNFEVRTVIDDLSPDQVKALGQALGLLPATVNKMSLGSIHLDMANAWLIRQDNVMSVCANGTPTWRELAKGLQKLELNGNIKRIQSQKGKRVAVPDYSEVKDESHLETDSDDLIPEGGEKKPVQGGGKKSVSGGKKPVSGGAVPDDIKDNSDKIGAAIILTNDYQEDPNKNNHLHSTKKDGERLEAAFNNLNFDVYWSHGATKDVLKGYIKKMKELKRQSFKNYRCIIFIVSGHGDNDKVRIENHPVPTGDEILYMYNFEKVRKKRELIERLFPEEFKEDHLGGIPKVFIFDACRGSDIQKTVIKNPSNQPSAKEGIKEELPPMKYAMGSNYLVAEATNKGYVAFGDEGDHAGGWWLKVICELLEEKKYLHSLEVLLIEAAKALLSKMRKNEKEAFVQPVRLSLLNDHICLDPNAS